MIKCSGFRHKRENQSNTRLTWIMLKIIYIMYQILRTNKKGIRIQFLQECQNMNKPTNETKNLMTHGIMLKTIKIFCKRWTFLLTSIIFNQDKIMYGTVMKLGFISMKYVTSSSILTSYFKAKEYRRCKLESEHHYGARYLYLPETIGNASCYPPFCTKPRINLNIYTSTFHWTWLSITHHMGIWIYMGVVKSRPNYPMYAAPPLLTIK